MTHSQTAKTGFRWLKPLIIIAFGALVAAGCKTTPTTTGGMPSPPGGGMPAPPSPGGGMPTPGGGMPSPPSPPGGESGDSGGESSPSGSESGESGGEVGEFPGEEVEMDGPPPMPGETGGGGARPPELEGGAPDDMTASGEDGDGDSEWEDESANADSECGDTGGMPGGVGGMGQDGECVPGGGGGASSSADSSSSSAASGGGAQSAEGAIQGTGGAGEVGEFPSETDAERAARLGKELEQSIGGFDEVLMEEQQEISSVGRNTEGFGGEMEGDGGISLGEQGMSTGGIVIANTSGVPASSPVDDLSQEEIRARTPEDIPITADDDIIARQLREAALAEDDPELRERLWEEYRKYRGM
jgi:hypothetical protein